MSIKSLCNLRLCTVACLLRIDCGWSYFVRREAILGATVEACGVVWLCVAKVKRLRYLEPTAMGKATVASELKIVIKPNIKTAVDVKAT